MTFENITSPAWADQEHSAITCVVQFSEFPDPLPFTARADDPELHGQAIYAALIAGEYGPIGEYVAPRPIVPEVVLRSEGKAVLIQAGLWDSVVAYVESISDPTQQALARVTLDDTVHWRRDSPTLNAAAAALGLTDQQLDDLFIAASEIAL